MNADRRQPQAYDDYADEPDEDPRAKRRRRIIFGVIAALLVAGVVLLIFWLSGSFRDKSETAQIPPVVNQQVTQAKAALQQAGFSSFAPNKNVVCGPEASNPGGQTCTEDQIGKVIAIDPEVGKTVPTTSTITLTVGQKPGNTTVPDLHGKSPDDAKAALEQAKLKLGNTTSQPVDNESDVGKVVSQNPTANSSATEGTPVDIVVGSGVNQKEVPNTVGKDYATAKQILQTAGFKAQRVDQASDQPKDQVIDQQPNGGNLPPNSTVKLTVSSGPQQIQMPDLTGMTQDQATQKLQSLGWSGSIQTQSMHGGGGQPNTVVKQNPQAGSQISPTQSITLTIKEDDGSGSTTSSSSGGIFPPGGIRNNG